MADVLEAPNEPAGSTWDCLYRARGGEVSEERPYFTGDIFEGVHVLKAGRERTKRVAIIQHPCAMRTNGVDLVPRLLVAEVDDHRILSQEEWRGYGKLMPLPALYPELTTRRRDQVIKFDELHVIESDKLGELRVACLSQYGVNLLLQRWVHHNSRVVVPTVTYQEQTGGVYEEADLVEEWCEERLGAGVSAEEAAHECMSWLRSIGSSGVMRQKRLEQQQNRSAIRKEMRSHLKSLAPKPDEQRS